MCTMWWKLTLRPSNGQNTKEVDIFSQFGKNKREEEVFEHQAD